MERKPSDEAVSPAEAQNTGPEHQTPPGPQERTDRPGAAEKRAERRSETVRPGGEPEVSDDR